MNVEPTHLSKEQYEECHKLTMKAANMFAETRTYVIVHVIGGANKTMRICFFNPKVGARICSDFELCGGIESASDRVKNPFVRDYLWRDVARVFADQFADNVLESSAKNCVDLELTKAIIKDTEEAVYQELVREDMAYIFSKMSAAEDSPTVAQMVALCPWRKEGEKEVLNHLQ